MAGETEADIPETGAVFTFGKSKFADNVPSKFWLKNGVPLKLACGDEHTALITENGKLFMFGSNNWGQLGLGEKISVNKPTCVKALKSEKVKLVACGRTHTLVYTSCGNLYTAGGNNEGQLGLGDFGERTSFQLVEFFTKHGPVKMIAAGSNTSAAITQDGKLYVWGDNSEGQIGLGEEEGTSTPRELDIGRQVTWISCGYYHSAFVTEDGALFSFGESDSGKLGLCISQFPNHRVPQQVEGICEPVLQVACGGGHTLVLTEKNLYTFGLGQFGQLGHGTFTFETLIPKEVEHFRKGKVKHIACGENHSAVLTESGLLYTFGDGRHGKLALGDEYFANQFKPTLCPRFLKYNVQAVTCGGCHMVVLAKPRLGSEVILEDNDVTEDHLEKLLREAESRHSLNRSLSARDRRRERERSPEQFGIMFQTLPRLNSGELDGSLPAPSQTLPSHLNNRTTNVFQRNSLPSSTGMLTEDHEVDGKTPVEIYRDNQSVKDLGETADLFNLTHAMKMDPAEKTITLSPVQKRKKVKAGGKRSQAVEQLTQDPGADRRWVGLSLSKALPTELLKSHRGKSQFGERQLPRNLHQSSESTGEDGDQANAVKENRIVRHTVRRHSAKTESQPKSKPDLQSKLIEIKPKAKVHSGQEDVHKYDVKARLSNVTGVETETEKEASKLEEKAKDIGQKGLYLTARSKTRSVDKRQRQAAEEKFLALITQVKRIPPESDGKVENLESNPIAVQSKPLDIEKDVKTWERNSSGEPYNRTSVAPRKTQSSKPERNMKKTKWLEAADGISSTSENTLPSSLVGVTSLTEDFPIKSPVRVLKEVASSQFSQTGASRNSLDKQTLLNTASIYEDPDKNVSKRTAVTINVKPVPAASDEETERIMSLDQTEEKTEGKEVESGKKEIGQMDGARKITDSGKLAKDRERVSSVESGMEERKSVAQVANDEGEGQDETTWKKVSQDEEREGAEKEEGSKTEPEKGEESDTESEEVSETVEQEEEECRINYDEEEMAKDSEEPEEEDSEEETESIQGEGDDGEEEDTAEEGKDGSEEGKGSVGTEQNKSVDEEEGGNESEAESMSGKEEQESEEEEKESEAGQEESREEQDGSVVEQEESEEEEGEESEAGKEEEDESEAGKEGEEEGEESEAGKEEEDESEAGKEEGEEEEEASEEEEEESEAGKEEEDESEAGKEGEEEGKESEAGKEEEEDESEAGKEEGEEEEEESEEEEEEGEAGKEEEAESEAGKEGEEEGKESEAGKEEEDESEAGKEEGEEEEEESEAGWEESEEEEESEAGQEESEGEEEESGAEKEESMGEEEDSGTEKEESEGEAEESEDEEEEKETETDSEEKDSGGEDEEGKDTDCENNVAKTEQENDREGEKEEEEGGEQAREDEDEKEEADQEGREKKKIQKDMTCKEDEERKKKGYEMPPKQKSLKSKKSPARRHQSSFESHEPRQFWDDVLPQYLNLK